MDEILACVKLDNAQMYILAQKVSCKITQDMIHLNLKYAKLPHTI